jgi:RNA 2',3'-cyclic 3'-phosphodiesterase
MTEPLIRCFVAAKVPAAVLAAIESYIQALKKAEPDVHWVKVDSMHITLKFLGEIKPDLVRQVEEILEPLAHLYKPFNIKVKGTGCFPNRSKPRVFWLGLEQDAGKSLNEIHAWIDDNLKPLGFSVEERDFSPHLTLGRVKKPQNFTNLFAYLEKTPFGEQVIEVDKIALMRSDLKPSGAEYSEIRSYSWSK